MFTFLCSLEVMGARGDVEVTRKLLSSTTSYEDSGAHTDVILQQSRDFTEENRTSLVHVFVYKKTQLQPSMLNIHIKYHICKPLFPKML